MTFSIKNGLKMTYYHMRNEHMLISFVLMSLPAFALWRDFTLTASLIYEVLLVLFIILIRCWDDPIQLGYEQGGVRE